LLRAQGCAGDAAVSLLSLMSGFDLSRRAVAEALGTAMLVATVVGSGIMAESLTKDAALALLCNTIPTGAILVVLIVVFGPISGAHFNPAVTLVFWLKRELSTNEALSYVAVQIFGGIVGTMIAHAMFGLPLFEASMKVRTGGGQWFAEAVASFGLIATILAGLRFERLGAMAGRPLYCGSVLVYGVDIICQSGGRDGAFADKHVFRHPSVRSAGFYRGRILRGYPRSCRHRLAVARG
jgi:glycerol uptake facilitator-like aquaporin